MKTMKNTKKQLLEDLAMQRQKQKDFEKAESNSAAEIKELRQSEALHRLLVEHANEAILVVEKKRIWHANPKSFEITGFSREELTSKNFMDLIHPDDRKLFALYDARARGGETASEIFTCRMVARNGHTKWLETKLLKTTWTGKSCVIYFLTDVTERKSAEEALRESEEKYRLLLNHAPAGIYEIDLTNGRFISFNDVICEYTGYTKEEFSSLNFTDLLTPESLKTQLERYEKILRGETVPDITELEWIGKNQRKSWIMVNSRIKYENDVPARVTVVAHDITSRKQLEEELNKAQKLESLAVLAGGIGHDFNNLLSGIMGNISLAKIEAERGEDIMESLDEALRVTSKASALTQQLLVFSKGGAPVKKAASIAEVLRESAAFTLRGSKVKCEYHISEDLWPVKVDVGQFSQVIHNLIINAMQAMSRGGQITLSAGNVTIPKIFDLPLNPGRYVVITIQDQGKGIAPENLPKIFDPYFTTKAKGSGLGLTMTYTTIKRHDGHISAASEVGKGTTFQIYLPATEEVPEKTVERAARPIRGVGRILVMDDEEFLRKVAERMLLDLGYEVQCVRDGAEAIAMYEAAKGTGQPFDAVIMDLTIPGGMGGKETISQLLQIDQKARCIVSSGYSNDPIMSNYKGFGFKGVVSKPYQVTELSWVLHDVLAQGSDTN
jgi:two-component system cell cycle sensor histidine kinase/response regulator CckA